ncbi:type I-E CRISPR-associated protein Cas7/Cse4/CasC [Citrobacter sp. Cb010]|nr:MULTISPECIES: type I-E CRISPR-associated protein Cas7/Cse4/CasC [unclassified Citrobacter]MDM3373916.1 type I-E CRISPR-associated protein Cas7/Cse4/CasC [Citrobacter sp. Cb010]MDM3461325.1 type I-E CRISPR-associated protein Cas7/Cse4/CasC [Citrobacter sp. Cb036]
MPIEKYWPLALDKAKAALATIPPPSAVAPFSGIQTLFPFIQQPTPLQQKVLELDIDKDAPQLFILEDVTGAGKTEAALILTHRLMAAGTAQGLYFGLPTMATANAMFDRLSESWLSLYRSGSCPSLVLAHSARGLMDKFNQSIWSTESSGSEELDDKQPLSQGCAAWFADSNKKALLAEVGVGTLDQAMMAVMPFKHNNLRLLGLSDKILLADEIHAYDAYMSRILESLIEHQARSGNSTILLSATLSQQQRDRLVAAFARGAGSRAEAPLLSYDDYPWLTQVIGQEVVSQHVATRKEVERSVNVGWLYSEESCIARIERAVSKGKCITWIRNSVDDAIRIYRQLLARGRVQAEHLSLFHSRFAFYDRQRIETQTLSLFGKGESTQRAGKVLIATQVIEQSLDIDMDEMISDLAPVDLLIQRAGRLQRHIRYRNGRVKGSGQDERDAPELVILAPEWDIANCFGKVKADKKAKDVLNNAETEQLVHISPAEFDAVITLAHRLAEEKRAPKEEELALLRKDRMAVDIAMFGRMLANKPEFNIEAACQVAHAFGVSETIVEDDFFTAVDDLRASSDDAGAGHLGETGFGSAMFYTYICIDKDLLVKNLHGNEELANKTLRAFTEAALKVSPTGKQNSFASRAYASWALAETGTDQPRSLAAAFYNPINGTNQLDVAVKRITELRENMKKVYGEQTKSTHFDVMQQQGSMKDVLDFICA